jgi:hypothetical protein
LLVRAPQRLFATEAIIFALITYINHTASDELLFAFVATADYADHDRLIS